MAHSQLNIHYMCLLRPTSVCWQEYHIHSVYKMYNDYHYIFTDNFIVVFIVTEATCWTPVSFTDQQNQYTNNYCSKSNTYYTMELDEIPVEDTSQMKNQIEKITPRLSKHLTTELLAVVIYLVLSHQALSLSDADRGLLLSLNSGSSPHHQGEDVPSERSKHLKNLMSSFGVAILYIIVQLAFITAIFVICSDFKETFPYLRVDDVILCDMEIRPLGNMHRYTVQCQLPSQAPYKLLYHANVVVCGFAGVIALLHLLYVFLVAPWWHRSVLKATLTDQKVIRNPKEVGILFIFSDLYMASRSASANQSNHAVFHPSGNPPASDGTHGMEMREIPRYQPPPGPPPSAPEQGMYPVLLTD